MRLGQISRKLAIPSSEILAFLASHHISIEDNANTRLAQEHVDLIYRRYAPELLEQAEIPREEFTEPEPLLQPVTQPAVDTPDLAVELPSEEAVVTTSDHPSESGQSATPLEELPDLIRAPKVALTGLKVLGKIELPEPKKKEAEEVADENLQARETTPRPGNQRRERREYKPYKNPVALQREQEVREELERRNEKARQEKERKTQNYLKKVKHSPPTKAVRLIDEPVEEMHEEQMVDEPKSWFGKFVKWLGS